VTTAGLYNEGGPTALIVEASGLTATLGDPIARPTSGSATLPGGPTARVAEAGRQTMPPGGLTAYVAEANGPTAPSGGSPAHPMALITSFVPSVATMTPVSPSTPCTTLTTPASTSAPHAALMTPLATSSVTPVSPLTAQSMPRVLSAAAVSVSPVVHPHPMRT
jgi:hypothetical protein